MGGNKLHNNFCLSTTSLTLNTENCQDGDQGSRDRKIVTYALNMIEVWLSNDVKRL